MMEEGELFSFRVVRGTRAFAPLLKWTVVDVNDSMTVCDVFRQIGSKIADCDAVTDDALVCQVSTKNFIFWAFFIFFHLSHTIPELRVTRNIEIKTCGLIR